jgi:hypothetical protein
MIPNQTGFSGYQFFPFFLIFPPNDIGNILFVPFFGMVGDSREASLSFIPDNYFWKRIVRKISGLNI